jgi:hypothetical protein
LFRQYHDGSADHPLLRRAPVLLTANELNWSRHSERSRVGRADQFTGRGFQSLVSWSTRELIGEPEGVV